MCQHGPESNLQTHCAKVLFFLEKAINKVGINHGRDLGMLRRKERRMAERRRIFPSHQEVEKKKKKRGEGFEETKFLLPCSLFSSLFLLPHRSGNIHPLTLSFSPSPSFVYLAPSPLLSSSTRVR